MDVGSKLPFQTSALHECGSGDPDDLVLNPVKNSTPFPLVQSSLLHPVSQLIYAGNRNQARHLWVAGKKLLDNYQLTQLDETQLIATAKAWAQKIGEATSA